MWSTMYLLLLIPQRHGFNPFSGTFLQPVFPCFFRTRYSKLFIYYDKIFLDRTFGYINNLLHNQWLSPMVSFKIYDEVPWFMSKPREEASSKSEFLCHTLPFKLMIMPSGTVDFAAQKPQIKRCLLSEDPEKL